MKRKAVYLLLVLLMMGEVGGSEWEKELVCEKGFLPRMTIDEDGKVHVVFLSAGRGGEEVLMYACRENGEWRSEQLATRVFPDSYDVVVGRGGDVYVFTKEGGGGTWVYRRKRRGSGWEKELVEKGKGGIYFFKGGTCGGVVGMVGEVREKGRVWIRFLYRDGSKGWKRTEVKAEGVGDVLFRGAWIGEIKVVVAYVEYVGGREKEGRLEGRTVVDLLERGERRRIYWLEESVPAVEVLRRKGRGYVIWKKGKEIGVCEMDEQWKKGREEKYELERWMSVRLRGWCDVGEEGDVYCVGCRPMRSRGRDEVVFVKLGGEGEVGMEKIGRGKLPQLVMRKDTGHIVYVGENSEVVYAQLKRREVGK